MKVIELLKLTHISLEILQNACIKISDVQYVKMYDEYRSLISENNKTSYAATVLSQKYGISERQFFYIIKRFEKDCKLPAT